MIDEREKSREGMFICIYCRKEHPVELARCLETGNVLSPVHKLLGTTLEGKYRITKFIGEGGMGVIYEAEHTTIGKKLAIKFMNPELCTSEESFERFKREAKAAAAIAHKNIVAVVDIGTTPHAIPYTIMEFLAGEDLAARMEKWGAVTFSEAAGILSQVLEALSAVHSCGIVHRDLKPENIFIARQSGGDEIIKILDFGVSRLTDAETLISRITKSGFVYGTPYYIAPEQAEGRTTVDHRADLYSAGTIFFEMITGKLPFATRAYGKLLVEIITKPPPDPSIYVPDLPQAVKEFIGTSLAKDPNERFQSADEMLRELKSIDMRTLQDRKTAAGSAKPARRTPFPRKSAPTPVLEPSARIHQALMDPATQKAAGTQASPGKPGVDPGPRKPASGAYRMFAGAVEKIVPAKPGSPGVSKPPQKQPLPPPSPASPKTAQNAGAPPRIPRPATSPATPSTSRKPSSDVDQAWTNDKDEDENKKNKQ